MTVRKNIIATIGSAMYPLDYGYFARVAEIRVWKNRHDGDKITILRHVFVYFEFAPEFCIPA